jgi:hypothetical protein
MTTQAPTGERADEGVDRIRAFGGPAMADLVDQISQER